MWHLNVTYDPGLDPGPEEKKIYYSVTHWLLWGIIGPLVKLNGFCRLDDSII